jgi:hypothetical protein
MRAPGGLVIAALAFSVAVSACGGDGGDVRARPNANESAAARQVRASVQGWLDNLETGKAKGNNERACGYLTRALQRSIDEQLRVRGEHATCATYAAKWTGRSTPPGNAGAHITAVNVRGAQATATLKAPPDRESEVQLRKVGGRWLIENY